MSMQQQIENEEQRYHEEKRVQAKIAQAIVAAQKAFGPALKTSQNPHFRSKYADLSACVEAVIDALNANGIALIQKTHPSQGGVCVETIFLHESGEFYSAGTLTVPAAKNDPQGYGSALTYARRYSLMAACGIAPEDDDGNAAAKAFDQQVRLAVSNISTMITENHATELCEFVASLSPEFKPAVWNQLGKQQQTTIKNLMQKDAA